MKYKKIITLCILACVILTACGSSKGSNGQKTDTTKKAESKVKKLNQSDIDDASNAMKKYIDAFFAGNDKEACALVTESYIKEKASEDGASDTCKGQVIQGSAAANTLGIKSANYEYSGRISGNLVIITAKSSGSDKGREYNLVKDSGEWKINSELASQTETYNKVVDEWNNLTQAERDSYSDFDSYAKSKGVDPNVGK